MKEALYIYNIFPRLYKDTKKWIHCVERAKYMGFNTIFLNAFFKCGASNSIYSIYDYYSFDKLSFQKFCDPEREIKKFNKYCHKQNMYTLVDLVINHTAPDSPLVKNHKSWYKFDKKGNVLPAGTPSDNGYHVWEDTAKLCYQKDDENGLKKYMLEVCKYYLELGFSGFRCDVASFVDPEVWDYLISEIRKIKPDAIFIGESFMSPSSTMVRMGQSGFDYIFSSSKWWDYEGDWLLNQYNDCKDHVCSISFPDNHDTERLIKTCKYDYNLFLQRVYFTGLFSKSFYITDGLEFACKKDLNVVTTRNRDIEKAKHNFMPEIKELLRIKSQFAPLHEESDTVILHNDDKYICLEKTYNKEKVLIIINKTSSKIKVKFVKDNLITKKELINGKKKKKFKILPMKVQVFEVNQK